MAENGNNAEEMIEQNGVANQITPIETIQLSLMFGLTQSFCPKYYTNILLKASLYYFLAENKISKSNVT